MNELSTVAAAQELKTLHDRIEGNMRAAVHDAIKAGEILENVKADLPHGEFTSWVEGHCPFSMKTAQRYMRANRRKDLLKNDSVTFLYQLTGEQKPEKSLDQMMLSQVKALEEEYAYWTNAFDSLPDLDESVDPLSREAIDFVNATHKALVGFAQWGVQYDQAVRRYYRTIGAPVPSSVEDLLRDLKSNAEFFAETESIGYRELH